MNDSNIEDLSQEATARLLLDMLHRTVVHYGLWFAEVRHQMGLEKAIETLHTVWEKSYGIQMKRLSKILGFEMRDGIPARLLEMPRAELLGLLDAAAVNWIANDGVWFQAVEFSSGMFDAKRCNDTCWAHFSPFEAKSIKRLLQMPARPGLVGLETALKYRLYARVNTQTLSWEGTDALVLHMNECRVQAARKRKGLADYPCKSGGATEYTYFARALDPRIETECIACPPDDHPPDWYCSWRFRLAEAA